MLKKTSDDVKKRVVFFIDFSSILREKSMENRAKSMTNAIVHKNRETIASGTPFFSKETIFGESLGPPWVASALPGRPGSVPKSLIFRIFSNFLLACRFRAAPGVSWDRFGSIFHRFSVDFGTILGRFPLIFVVNLLSFCCPSWTDFGLFFLHAHAFQMFFLTAFAKKKL